MLAGLAGVGILLAISVLWLTERADQQPFRASSPAAGESGRPTEELLELDLDEAQSTRDALQMHLALLEAARERLGGHKDYSAVFARQERVGGRLRDPETIDLLIRHEPFSTRMQWRESRREVIYIEGRNDAKMLVRLGGLGRVFGRIRMELDDPRVRAESRYPVTEVGLLKLVERIIGYRERDLTLAEGVECRVEHSPSPDGRDSYRFTFEYAGPDVEPLYRKSVIWIDRETRLPLVVRNFTWPDDDTARTADELDEATLLEFYAFRELQFDLGLTDEDFTGSTR